MADAFQFEMNVQIDDAQLQRLKALLPSELRAVVQKTAHDIEAGGKQRVPVDTGATKNSIHVNEIDDGFGAAIGPTTEYAPYLELGTVHMAARPFMVPSLEENRPKLEEAIRQMLERLNG